MKTIQGVGEPLIADRSRYYVASTQPNRERYAFEKLAEQSFQAYLPECLERVRHARRDQVLKRPLFPGYLFLLLDIRACRWRSINGTPGVIRILTQDDAPIPLPEGIVEAIMERIEADGGAWKMSENPDAPSFNEREPLRIKSGPFAGNVGVFNGFSNRAKTRVQILLDILGGEYVHEAPLTIVEPLG